VRFQVELFAFKNLINEINRLNNKLILLLAEAIFLFQEIVNFFQLEEKACFFIRNF